MADLRPFRALRYSFSPCLFSTCGARCQPRGLLAVAWFPPIEPAAFGLLATAFRSRTPAFPARPTKASALRSMVCAANSRAKNGLRLFDVPQPRSGFAATRSGPLRKGFQSDRAGLQDWLRDARVRQSRL